MPDPTRATLSATESPALFHASPYVTPWMLYQSFRNAIDLNIESDDRMSEGMRMQPLVLERAEKELRLQVIPNTEDNYVRRGRLGCTRDAIVIHPEKGPGALEAKCVFDYAQWMGKWGGGDSVPRDYEIQLQQQMFVGDENGPFSWGVIVAWIGGNQLYFHREPIPKLWEELQAAADKFFDDVELGREPEPFGAPIEVPWLMKLYPTDETKIIDLRDTPSSLTERLIRQSVTFNTCKRAALVNAKAAESLRGEFIAKLRGAGLMLLPGGGSIRMSKGNRLTVRTSKTETQPEEQQNGE